MLDKLFSWRTAQKYSSRKIGLALGGGAVLGAAHIGVLKALEENDIQIDSITGTSIGAFVAALHAFGISAREIEVIVTELGWLDISKLALSKYGVLSNEKLGKAMREIIGDVSFSDAKIPLAVIATNIASGNPVVLNQGDVATATMASTCVPGVFAPVELDGQMLVDGGLVENVPLSPLRDMGANFIIGVDLNAKRQYEQPGDMIDVLMNALDIAIDNSTRLQTKNVDLLITPEVFHFSRTDRDNIEHLVSEGYKAAAPQLKEFALKCKHPVK
ncbi:MAG: patatin-like phospholipase family protein [Gammaproteobacteria bacterium]|nr:patatin-like phospholipase family protein [Gammaproteobacteria bacterium]